jgi:hypothetical protein
MLQTAKDYFDESAAENQAATNKLTKARELVHECEQVNLRAKALHDQAEERNRFAAFVLTQAGELVEEIRRAGRSDAGAGAEHDQRPPKGPEPA